MPHTVFGAWRVVQVDATGKRALVVCRCGVNRQIAIETLASGESLGCGCTLTPWPKARSTRQQAGFASEIASAEHWGALKRQNGRGYEP